MRCECCGCELSGPEVATCDECHMARLERCLASEAWRTVRGPEVVSEMEAELELYKALAGMPDVVTAE